MRGRIEVQFISRHECMVRGHGSYDLLERLTGRRPVRRPLRSAWACQERTARALVALAEAEGYDVLVLGPRGSLNRKIPDETPVPATPVGGDAGTGHQVDEVSGAGQLEFPW